jgi:hypothetical protein
MPDYEPIDYRLRCHSKRTDLPPDVLRDICEAYEYMELLRDELTERIHMCDMRSEKILELTAERDEARREICVMLEDATNNHRENHAKRWGWDCYKEDGKCLIDTECLRSVGITSCSLLMATKMSC